MTIILENQDALISLCKKHKVMSLYAFGSVVRDTLNTDSDIDFLVNFQEIPLLEYSDTYFDFLFSLEDLFKRKIDLVIEKSLSNPFFIHSISKSKELIYETGSSKMAV